MFLMEMLHLDIITSKKRNPPAPGRAAKYVIWGQKPSFFAVGVVFGAKVGPGSAKIGAKIGAKMAPKIGAQVGQMCGQGSSQAGLSWLFLVALGCCWLLLAPVGCCWLLLAVVGCSWLVLGVVGCC